MGVEDFGISTGNEGRGEMFKLKETGNLRSHPALPDTFYLLLLMKLKFTSFVCLRLATDST